MSSSSPRVSNGTSGSEGVKLERKDSVVSRSGDPRVGRMAEDGTRRRDPRNSPSRGKSPRKRKSGEGADVEGVGRNGGTGDAKRHRSL